MTPMGTPGSTPLQAWRADLILNCLDVFFREIWLRTDPKDVWGPPKRKVFRFHAPILSFGEPGSLRDNY